MSRTTRLPIVALTVAALSGCLDAPTGALSSKATLFHVDVEKDAVLKEENGAITARIDPTALNEQRVEAAASSAIAKTRIIFPPGALGVATDVTVEEGASLASALIAESLGIAKEGEIKTAGNAVVIASDVKTDALQPFTVTLAIDDGAGFGFALAEEGSRDERLAVLYKVYKATEGRFVLGILPRSALARGTGQISFPTRFFGSYEPIYLPKAQLAPAEVETKSPILTKAEEREKLAQIAWQTPLAAFDASTRTVTASATVTGLGALVECKLALDADGKAPYDLAQLIGPTLKAVVGIPPNLSGNFAAAFYCSDEAGVVTASPWSTALSIPVVPQDELKTDTPTEAKTDVATGGGDGGADDGGEMNVERKLAYDKTTLAADVAVVAAGQYVTLTVRVFATDGSPLAGVESERFALKVAPDRGGDAENHDPFLDLGDGRYETRAYSPYAGARLFKVVVDGVDSTATASVTITPGPFDPGASGLFVETPLLRPGKATIVRFVPMDGFGNAATVDGTLAFTTTDPTATFSKFGKNPDGTFTADLMIADIGVGLLVGVTKGGADLGLTASYESFGPPDLATSETTLSASTVAAGDAIQVKLYARDVYGRPIPFGDHAIVADVLDDGTSDGTFGNAVFDPQTMIYTLAFTGTTIGSPSSVIVEADGVQLGSPPPQIEVLPGAPAQLAVVSQPPTAIAGFEMPYFKVEVRDAGGNLSLALDGQTMTVSLTGSGSLSGTLTAVVAGGLASFYDLAVTLPGNQDFQFDLGGLSTSVSVGVAAPSLDITSVSPDPITDPLFVAKTTTANITPGAAFGSVANALAAVGTSLDLADSATLVNPATSTVTPSMNLLPDLDITSVSRSWQFYATHNAEVAALTPSPTCSIVGPLSGLSCNFLGIVFNIDAPDIQTTAIPLGATLSVTDGTATGGTAIPLRRYHVRQVMDVFATDDAQSHEWPLVVFDGKLWFPAELDTDGIHLMRLSHDGSGEPIIDRVTDANAGAGAHDIPPSIGDPRALRAINVGGHDRLYLPAMDASFNTRLAYLQAGSSVVRFASTTGVNANPSWFAPVGNAKVLYAGTNAAGGTKLFAYDPAFSTSGQITQLTDLHANPAQSEDVGWIVEALGAVYFVADAPSSGRKLFRMALNFSAVERVCDTSGLATTTDAVSEVIEFNGEIYFSAMNGSGFHKLFRYDGAGCKQVTDLNAADDLPRSLTVFNGDLWFSALDGTGNRRLFRLTAGNVLEQVSQTNGAGSDEVSAISLWDSDADGTADRLVFTGDNATGLQRLFIHDGSRILQATSHSSYDQVGPGVNFDGYYYFWARNGAGNLKLHRLRLE